MRINPAMSNGCRNEQEKLIISPYTTISRDGEGNRDRRVPFRSRIVTFCSATSTCRAWSVTLRDSTHSEHSNCSEPLYSCFEYVIEGLLKFPLFMIVADRAI